jgi:hypothetical protein
VATPLTQAEVNGLNSALFQMLARPANPIIYYGDELAYHGTKAKNDALSREAIK